LGIAVVPEVSSNSHTSSPEIDTSTSSVADDPSHDVGRHHRIDGCPNQPRLGDADQHQHGLDGVVTEQQHSIAPLQSGAQQRVGDPVGVRVGLAVGQASELGARVGALPADDRVLVGPTPGHSLQQIADRHPVEPIRGPAAVQTDDIESHRLRLSPPIAPRSYHGC
jgi:hypothetical protein